MFSSIVVGNRTNNGGFIAFRFSEAMATSVSFPCSAIVGQKQVNDYVKHFKLIRRLDRKLVAGEGLTVGVCDYFTWESLCSVDYNPPTSGF